MCSFLVGIVFTCVAFSSIAFADIPPTWGPYQGDCRVESIHIGTLVSGYSQSAFLVYPKEVLRNASLTLPFLAFAHGMTAGGEETFVAYEPLWEQMCSHGYIIAGPKSCRVEYCQDFYQDVISTIELCAEQRGNLSLALDSADFEDGIGVFGHSMGGAATVHISNAETAKRLNVIASVALHPSTQVDHDKNEAADVGVPMLFFAGSVDHQVPASVVRADYHMDPIVPKVFAVLENATHYDPTLVGDNLENPYVAQYFNCHIKKNADACQTYIYGTGRANQNDICDGGYHWTECYVNGTYTPTLQSSHST